jgi:preprotein translocase SecE subunit
MATDEDVKTEKGEEELEQEPCGRARRRAPAPEDAHHARREVHDVAPVGAASPSQLGTRRFVYAAYFAGAIGIAFLMRRSSSASPGSSRRPTSLRSASRATRSSCPSRRSSARRHGCLLLDRTRARELADEVATEMSKVTWPSRTEVTNGTFVVIVTTIVSTVFFALMDKFWGFVTNLVYGGS